MDIVELMSVRALQAELKRCKDHDRRKQIESELRKRAMFHY